MDPFKAVANANHLLNLTEGNIAVIPCELPNGNPRPLPVFTLDGTPIDIESNSSTSGETNARASDTRGSRLDRYKILPSGNLHIVDIKPSDSGTYQCAARNPLTGQSVNNSQVTIVNIGAMPAANKDRAPLTTVYKPPVASR